MLVKLNLNKFFTWNSSIYILKYVIDVNVGTYTTVSKKSKFLASWKPLKKKVGTGTVPVECENRRNSVVRIRGSGSVGTKTLRIQNTNFFGLTITSKPGSETLEFLLVVPLPVLYGYLTCCVISSLEDLKNKPSKCRRVIFFIWRLRAGLLSYVMDALLRGDEKNVQWSVSICDFNEVSSVSCLIWKIKIIVGLRWWERRKVVFCKEVYWHLFFFQPRSAIVSMGRMSLFNP